MEVVITGTIPSLLRYQVRKVSKGFVICCSVASERSVATLFRRGGVSLRSLRIVLKNFVRVVRRVSRCLLGPYRLVLRPRCVCLSTREGDIQFYCLPKFRKRVRGRFRDLTRCVLPGLSRRSKGTIVLKCGMCEHTLRSDFRLRCVGRRLCGVYGDSRRSFSPCRGGGAIIRRRGEVARRRGTRSL